MKFFEQQDRARRQTKKLVALFILAVAAIVVAVNVTMALLWSWLQGHAQGIQGYPHYFFLTNTLATLMLILGGMLVEFFNLREGGDAVARMAGGRLLATDTRDAYERRLINVVEEMALASGIACPRTYVLDREPSINAFAAGHSLNEAVIAVTRGTLERLSRDELQGVVAHEFSHILNGDMRLNLHLIGVLFGIQMVAGLGQQMMGIGSPSSLSGMSRRRDGKDGMPLHLFVVAAGGVLFAVGYIGLFFARLIKSAVSRQREFLADASAVQFTRNPDGIGNALRKIGGLVHSGGEEARIAHGNAEHLSHLFLNAIKPGLLEGLFATHPSLQERLHRIYGRNRTWLEAPVAESQSVAAAPARHLPELSFTASDVDDIEVQAARSEAVNDIAAVAAQAYGDGPLRQIRLAPDIDRAAHDPHAAVALVLALFMESGTMQAEAQRDFLQRHLPQQSEAILSMAAAIRALPHNARLPLLELSIPALRRLPVGAHMAMLDHVERLVAEDRRVTLQEFILQIVLLRRLDARAQRATPIRFHALADVRTECMGLFSLAAHVVAPLEKQPPSVVFSRIIGACPQLALEPGDLLPPVALRRTRITAMLERVDQLAPLLKPALIKGLLAAAEPGKPLQLVMADLLRAICVAMDVPMPAAVASVYIASGWPED